MSTKHGYKKIHNFLLNAFKNDLTFTIEDVVKETDLKKSSLSVYFRNKLINVYVRKKDNGQYFSLSSIKECTEEEFEKYCSQREPFTHAKNQIEDNLLQNSIYSMLSAIEIHNKPLIQYRYQIVTILVINSWELILKSYISKYLKSVKLIKADGTTKPFPECVNCVVDTIGKELFVLRENLNAIYEYRCKYIHFFYEGLDLILLSLIQKSIILYSGFIYKYFGKRISEISDFYILPIGFTKPLSPIDYLTNKSYTEKSPQEVKDFIRKISESTETLNQNGISETIFVPYSMTYKSESRLNNADIIAAINQNKNVNISITEEVVFTEDQSAKKVRIEEQRIIDDIFPLTYGEVTQKCKEIIPGFKINKQFYEVLAYLKKDLSLHHVRKLNPKNPKSAKQDFYSKRIVDVLESMLIQPSQEQKI